MIIDCHGHFTTAPPGLAEFHEALLAPGADIAALSVAGPRGLSEEQVREAIEPEQLRLQRERGIDLTLFSPQASAMAHHRGDPKVSAAWTRACNDLIHQVSRLYPDRFAPVCQLPQSPQAAPRECVSELRRCVEELGFVGCNLNPDPSGGHWTGAPITDRSWYPLYEAMVELDVPAMIHVSGSCNPNFHTTGGYYLAADTTVFMTLLSSRLFRDFPTLRLILPHGGGAVPYHWGRYRGLAQELGYPPLEESVLDNLWFDTCLYGYQGVRLLTEVVPVENILFGSEMIGAVRGIDPVSGHAYDDTRRYVEAAPRLDEGGRAAIYAGNALRVYPRLARRTADEPVGSGR
ncbi:amidohydrolase family protein [Streptomyces sp. NPDC005492]|uniref:amidohydrolase family protein n=1 Tax=Streptomyces sp. NPDC005492 TaxID=3156883 RepID=UPI0033B34238